MAALRAENEARKAENEKLTGAPRGPRKGQAAPKASAAMKAKMEKLRERKAAKKPVTINQTEAADA
jgi:hypothetical protein